MIVAHEELISAAIAPVVLGGKAVLFRDLAIIRHSIIGLQALLDESLFQSLLTRATDSGPSHPTQHRHFAPVHPTCCSDPTTCCSNVLAAASEAEGTPAAEADSAELS